VTRRFPDNFATEKNLGGGVIAPTMPPNTSGSKPLRAKKTYDNLHKLSGIGLYMPCHENVVV